MSMSERDLVSGMAVFVAVVEAGSLAGAARRTGLTASAVSKLVSRLEQGFGTALLRRTTRRMTVTDAGLTFYERACSVLLELRAVEQEMASKDSEPRGRLRISASLLLGQVHVLPSLLSFLKKEPRVALDLDLTDRTVDLVSERVDVAVRITASPPPAFVARRVGSVASVRCASPGYLKARGVPHSPAELPQHSRIQLLDTAAIEHSGSARLRFSSSVAVHEAARAGLGIAELPGYLVADDLRARRLTRVLAEFEDPARSVYVIYAAGSLLPTRVREVVRHLERELKKALG